MDVEKTAKMNVASHLDFRSNGLNTAPMTSAFTNYSSQSFQLPLTGHYYPQQFTSSSQDSDLLRRID